jgi:hypothetical protein
MYVSGRPTASETIGQAILPEPFILFAGLVGSFAKSKIAATGSSVLTIHKNGASIGTITFAAAATVGTFVFSANVSFDPGDLLDVTNPASADATLADLTIMLYGSL